MLRNTPDDQKSGTISEQNGQDCKSDPGKSKIACGYLKLENKANAQYKLQLSYENTNNSGKLKIVSRDNSQIKYYDNGQWHPKQLSGDQLTTFQNTEKVNSGESIPEMIFQQNK